MDRSINGNTLKGYSDVLNVKQVSEILQVSEKNVYKQLNSGSLHSVRVGREFRIPKGSLFEYLYGKDKDGKK